MERIDEALPSPARRPPVAPAAPARAPSPVSVARLGASLADRLLLGSALLLVLCAAGLASGGPFEPLLLGSFGVGVLLTSIARRMLDARARAANARR